jgi:hypothetical protein
MPVGEDAAWRRWVPHAPWGGCRNYNNTQVCTHPQERFDHVGAVVLEAKPVPAPGTGTLTRPPAHVLVYGGFSQLCGDYCSDMWEFPLDACAADAEAEAATKAKAKVDVKVEVNAAEVKAEVERNHSPSVWRRNTRKAN